MTSPDFPQQISPPNDDATGAENRRLATLFAIEDQTGTSWDKGDLAALLRHQLSAPLEEESESKLPDDLAKAQSSTEREAAPIRTFNDLFHHPSPPLALLRMVKDFAKLNRIQNRGALPPEVAVVIYYAAIAAALLRHGEAISNLAPTQLLKGIVWALERPWLDGSLEDLFRETRRRLGQVG